MAVVNYILGTQLPEDLRERLMLDQAKDFSYVISAIAVLGLNTIALIFFDFLHAPWLVGRSAAILGAGFCYIAILFNARAWLQREQPTQMSADAYIGRMARLLFLLGCFWSALLLVVVREAGPWQLCLLYAIMTGCLATPVVVSPALCAFAYWLPVSIGVTATMIASHHANIFAVVDLLAFVALTGFCIFFLNRRTNERAISAIRLEENTEVIRLLLRDFEESASDWLWETNAQMELQQVSHRLVQVARRPAEALTGPFPEAILGEGALRDAPPGSSVERLRRAIAERSPFRDLVIPVMIENELRYWSLTGKPILDKHGRFGGYHGVGSDITGQRRQQEHISFLARHDSLTKLANRMLFSEVLHQCCENAANSGFALLCLDLDNFKMINDSLGHATGDAVLVAVAERLRGCIRDFDIAARLGGDEFAILVMTSDENEAQAIANRIIERIMRPFHFDGQALQIGVSIGIANAPRDGDNPTALMKSADLALYRAKSDGRGIVRIFDQGMDDMIRAKRAMHIALRQALARQELSVAYQPIVDLNSGQIISAEALVRWQHAEQGEIPPGRFIPIAEEFGLIEEIGDFVLRQACAAVATWPAHISVAVNLSPSPSGAQRLVQSILDVLAEHELPPERLELEVVESTILEVGSPTEQALCQLHEHGVRIALDDFGTGYSSLSYLRRFPFSKLKIDGSFVRDLGNPHPGPGRPGETATEKADSSIILAIIGLAENMNMAVTAEGVETAEQAEILRSYGCTQAQGYLFHKPMDAARIAALLRDAPPPRRVSPPRHAMY